LAPQVLIKSQANAFVMVKSYPSVVEDSLVEFAAEFVREAIACVRDEVMFFVVLENASLMDAGSWALFEAVTGQCEHMIVVTCLQAPIQGFNEHNGASDNFKIADHAQSYYLQHIRHIEDQVFHTMEMEPLSAFDLRQILIDQADAYQKSMVKEIEMIIAIIDSQLNQVKTGESQNEIKRKLSQQYQVYNVFREVERPLIDRVIQKCNGNPHQSIGILYQMLIVSLDEVISVCVE
jgi:hypothetical protein